MNLKRFRSEELFELLILKISQFTIKVKPFIVIKIVIKPDMSLRGLVVHNEINLSSPLIGFLVCDPVL